jgi:hypothetical protein
MGDQRETSSSSAFSTIGGSKDQSSHYNTPAIQIGNAVRDGDEFVLLVRSRQSEGFQVWSSGDKETTEQLYTQAKPSITSKDMAT